MAHNKCTTGWLKEVRDPRTYSAGDVSGLIKKFSKEACKKVKVDENSVDLAYDGGNFEDIPIENQKDLPSCTAHAVVGLLQYFQQVTQCKNERFSRLFLYKTTRLLEEKLLQLEKEKLLPREEERLEKIADLIREIQCNGLVTLHATLEAMRLTGVPLEDNFPYNNSGNCTTGKWNREPSCDDYGDSVLEHKGIIYYSLIDNKATHFNGNSLLDKAKESLENGIPFAFGFDVYEDIEKGIKYGNGERYYPYHHPYKKDVEFAEDIGHAAIAVGYDDGFKIDGYKCKGALKIRNSYGIDWGHEGYGWLSYDYIRKGFINAKDKKNNVGGFFCLIDANFRVKNSPASP